MLFRAPAYVADAQLRLARYESPEVATLIAAMVQARDAVGRRSWSHPQEPTGEGWWADVLADPRARLQPGRMQNRGALTIYRLRDVQQPIILVACSKCDWRAAFSRDELIVADGADQPLPDLLDYLAVPGCPRLVAPAGTAAGFITSSQLRPLAPLDRQRRLTADMSGDIETLLAG